MFPLCLYPRAYGLRVETADLSTTLTSVRHPLSIESLPFPCHPRACDFYDLLVFSAYPISCISSPPQSRHPERSASQIYRKQGVLSAESKDPGDARWQMLFGVSGRELHGRTKRSQTPAGAKRRGEVYGLLPPP